jgi:hypothetical protein
MHLGIHAVHPPAKVEEQIDTDSDRLYEIFKVAQKKSPRCRGLLTEFICLSKEEETDRLLPILGTSAITNGSQCSTAHVPKV